MLLSQLAVRRSSFSLQQLFFPLHKSIVFFSTSTTAKSTKECTLKSNDLCTFDVKRKRHYHHRHHYATFKRLLCEMRGEEAFGDDSYLFDTAVAADGPLIANDALMERLGVMDLTDSCVHRRLPASEPLRDNIALTQPMSTVVTEACKAGVACQLPPTVVLRKVFEAASAIKKNGVCVEWLPPGAAVVLLRSAAQRVAAKAAALRRFVDGVVGTQLPRDVFGWPRSDQGQAARLRWAFAEEMRCAYGLLAALPRCRQLADLGGQEDENVETRGGDTHSFTQLQYVDELRATLQLAAELQDHVFAADTVEKLITFCNKFCKPDCKNKELFFGEIVRDVAVAISAFSTCRDFVAARGLYEKFVADIPLSNVFLDDSSGNSGSTGFNSRGIISSSNNDEGLVKAGHYSVAFEKLRLFAVLAACIDANPAHFTYLRDVVIRLFLDTDVGYHHNTRQASRETICAVLRALSRVTLEPHAKMAAAQFFFCTVQQNSHADVCVAPCVTEELLQVASAARDSQAASLLYNQLAAPNVRRAEMSANMAAILLTEKDALNDFARFLSFVNLRRRVISSVAVHLLAAKLLLQRKSSDVVYTVLNLIQAAREVDPQRVFFLRLVVFYRDLLQKRILRSSTEKNLFFSALRLRKHTQTVLQSWREELQRAGVTTLAFTTLQLLQEIRQFLVKADASQKELTDEENKTLHSLLAFVDEMLFDFSLGWLRHRAAVTRTPRYHLSASELRRWINGDWPSNKKPATVFLRTLRGSVLCPAHLAKLSVEELIAALRTVFDALHAAADAGDVVVLGFGDYVRLCWLEDASLMCTKKDPNYLFPLSSLSFSADSFFFSLDRLNSCTSRVYVTDALGEMTLQEGMCASSPPATETTNVVIRRDIFIVDELVDFSLEKRCGEMMVKEEEWLMRWLEESRVLSHAVSGVFEQKLELLLQMSPLFEATQEDVKYDKDVSASTVLEHFVSLDC